jgi:hypothetical protein
VGETNIPRSRCHVNLNYRRAGVLKAYRKRQLRSLNRPVFAAVWLAAPLASTHQEAKTL